MLRQVVHIVTTLNPTPAGHLARSIQIRSVVTKHNGGMGLGGGGRDAVLTGEPECCVRRPLWLSLGL